MSQRFTERFGTYIIAAVALAGFGIAQPAQALPGSDNGHVAYETVQTMRPLLAQTSTLPADGLYLFGAQPVADQLATAYLVFELQAGRVTGAFYMPHSSFDCFQGGMDQSELALTITDSDSQERYTYAQALEQGALVASTGDVTEFSLAGFHQLEQLSANDHRLLETCQASYGDVI